MRSLLALFALVPLAAACGSSGTLSVDPVAKAAENTTHVSTLHMSMDARITVPGAARPLRMTATGGFQNDQKRGSLLLDMSDFARQLPASSKLSDPGLWRGEEVVDFST